MAGSIRNDEGCQGTQMLPITGLYEAMRDRIHRRHE
jgi:hypothetical protein